MSIFIGILLVLFVIVSVLLVLIILPQDDGTDGAGIIFGSAATQQYGVRKGNIITKTTSILAVIFIVIAFGLSFLFQYTNKINDLNITEAPVTSDTSLEWWNTDVVEEDIPLENPIENDSISTDSSLNDDSILQNDGNIQNEEQSDTTTGTESNTE